MIPKSFSASSLQVAEGCLSRYQATSVERAADFGSDAARLGTSVHGALEAYVQVYQATGVSPPIGDLLMMFKVSYMDTFGTAVTDTPAYDEGVVMLKAWHKRLDTAPLGNVVSTEVKTSYMVKTSAGEIPFNYIWDRFDQYDEDEYAVIDYKTNRWAMTHDQLRNKIQARMYGVMAQIAYPNAKRIHVKFDMLRHDGPIGVVFSKDENIATWRWFKAEIERIIATPDDDVPETLNPECSWCVRAASCKTLASNISVGGTMGLTLDEQVSLRARLDWQLKGINSLRKELDNIIELNARQMDVLEFESDEAIVKFTAKQNRVVDASRVVKVVGDEIFGAYGGTDIALGQFDKLLKDPRLSAEQVGTLKSLVSREFGNPTLKVDPKSPFGV